MPDPVTHSVETPYGPVTAHFVDGTVIVTTDNDQPVTINGVAYRMRYELTNLEEGDRRLEYGNLGENWFTNYASAGRADRWANDFPSQSARRKMREIMSLVVAFIIENPDLLHDGVLAARRRDLARVEAELTALEAEKNELLTKRLRVLAQIHEMEQEVGA